MMTTLAWMGAGIGRSLSYREFGQDLSGKRLERHREGAESVKSKSMVSGEPCKNCNPSRQFFPQLAEMAQRTRNKIAQAGTAALRELPVVPRKPFAARKLNSRVEES